MTEIRRLPIAEAKPVVMAAIGDDQVKLKRARGATERTATSEHV